LPAVTRSLNFREPPCVKRVFVEVAGHLIAERRLSVFVDLSPEEGFKRRE